MADGGIAVGMLAMICSRAAPNRLPLAAVPTSARRSPRTPTACGITRIDCACWSPGRRKRLAPTPLAPAAGRDDDPRRPAAGA